MGKWKPLPEPNSTAVFKSFCRWTSIRGLQHVVRAENWFIRSLWAIFVVIMFCANLALVCILIERYYRFHTIETIQTYSGVRVTFPAVTVCNVDPVNSERIRCLKEKKCGLEGYTSILSKYNESGTSIKKYKNKDEWNTLEDSNKISIFYQMIGMEAANRISHQEEDFIIADFCQVTTQEKGGILKARKCKEADVNIFNFVTYKYFNCFTLTITNTTISEQTVRLSIMLYLDEEEDLNCAPYCTHEFTEWSGGKAVVHAVGVMPKMDQTGLNLLPGASNQILISESKKVRRKTMNNKACVVESPENLMFAFYNSSAEEFQSREIMYTDSLCIDLKSQNATMNECHCIDFKLPIPGRMKHHISKLPICGNMTHPDALTNIKCSQNIRQQRREIFSTLCPVNCESEEYNFELTQLRWPQKPQILKYHEKLKHRGFYRRKFEVYENISKIVDSDPKTALRMLQETNVFENNFLQVDINRPNPDVQVVYEENETYSLPTFLSQLGGICSVFLSFTCVTVLELFELAFRLIYVVFPKKRRKSRGQQPDVHLHTGGNLGAIESIDCNKQFVASNAIISISSTSLRANSLENNAEDSDFSSSSSSSGRSCLDGNDYRRKTRKHASGLGHGLDGLHLEPSMLFLPLRRASLSLQSNIKKRFNPPRSVSEEQDEQQSCGDGDEHRMRTQHSITANDNQNARAKKKTRKKWASKELSIEDKLSSSSSPPIQPIHGGPYGTSSQKEDEVVKRKCAQYWTNSLLEAENCLRSEKVLANSRCGAALSNLGSQELIYSTERPDVHEEDVIRRDLSRNRKIGKTIRPSSWITKSNGSAIIVQNLPLLNVTSSNCASRRRLDKVCSQEEVPVTGICDNLTTEKTKRNQLSKPPWRRHNRSKGTQRASASTADHVQPKTKDINVPVVCRLTSLDKDHKSDVKSNVLQTECKNYHPPSLSSKDIKENCLPVKE